MFGKFFAMDKLIHIFLLTFYLLESYGFPSTFTDDCPIDCVCYSDYLHNLDSWKWVETDVHSDKDDPENEAFNPYTDHNEVYENPKLHKQRQRESTLATITCMLRNNETDFLESTFNIMPRHAQVLSLIQAPGSGAVHLTKKLFARFHSLVGLEIRGYSDNQDLTKIAADSFQDLVTLTYLNLEAIELEQSSVENHIHTGNPRILKINYTFNDVVTNEITSQLLIITPDPDKDNESDAVVPYSEYRKSHPNDKTAPLEPKFRVAFTGLPKLQHLKISSCNLHDISWDMFFKLDNLKYLLLDENDLLFLPDFVFYATSNLSALSLSRNRILNLQTVGLVGLLHLQKLDVTYNNITHLSELSLPPFPHLEVADFRFNPIDSIFPNTFEIMNSTKTLYLGSPTTPLDLSPNSFYGLTSLIKLDITNVKIRLLEKAMLKGMPSLKTLTMTGDVPRISYDAFGEVASLEKLTMRNCGVRKISMDAFFGLASLSEIDLSHNSISFLPPGIFEDQINLREVFLQHNQLTTLPANLIEDLPVKIIRLEANPWHCSCDMKNWNPQQVNKVKRYHIPAPNTTLCQKAYDKGSMCFETYEPKFEAAYSYEKRVSPVCETPLKFNQRSVFQVLRKELKYCVKNETESDPATKLKLKLQKLQSFPENYSEETLKKLEKQLLAKPIKIRKPARTTIATTVQTTITTHSTNDHDSPVSKSPLLMTEAAVETNQSIPSVANDVENRFHNVTLNVTSMVTHSTYLEQTINETLSLNADKFTTSNGPTMVLNPTNHLTTTQSTTFFDKLAWLQSNFRVKEKKRNKVQPFLTFNEDTGERDRNQSQLPAISKKALKLARAQKRRS